MHDVTPDTSTARTSNIQSEIVMRLSGSDRVLVIMAKAPRPGAVKTRLTPNLSPEAVTAFYCCLLDDTLALARSLEVAGVEVAVMCPESDVDELARLAGMQSTGMPLSGKAASVVAQKGEGLAAGLTSVFAHFAEGRRTNAMHTDDASLPSTATARTCRVLFSKMRSKPWPHMTWSLDQRTTEATISSGQRLPILRFSQATEWAPAARWRDSWRARKRLSFP